MNNYGAATFAFSGSKIWEKIPSKFKKLSYNSFYKQHKLVQKVLLSLLIIISIEFYAKNCGMFLLLHFYDSLLFFLVSCMLYASSLHVAVTNSKA